MGIAFDPKEHFDPFRALLLDDRFLDPSPNPRRRFLRMHRVKCGSQLGLVPQVKPNRTGFCLVQQPFHLRLEHHRIPDRLGGAQRLFHGIRHGALRKTEPMSLKPCGQIDHLGLLPIHARSRD